MDPEPPEMVHINEVLGAMVSVSGSIVKGAVICMVVLADPSHSVSCTQMVSSIESTPPAR